jgi:hypothetical protein
MRIEEVEDILNAFRLLSLLAPQHVFITDESIVGEVDGELRFRGLAPARGSVMVLGRDADASTVPHEWAHTALGLGEAAAYPFGRVMRMRYELRRMLPVSPPKLVEARYRPAEVPERYRGRVEHYERA